MTKKHEDPDKVYKLDEDQKKIVNLTIGKSEPVNQGERELADEIEEIKKKGWIVDIPFD